MILARFSFSTPESILQCLQQLQLRWKEPSGLCLQLQLPVKTANFWMTSFLRSWRWSLRFLNRGSWSCVFASCPSSTFYRLDLCRHWAPTLGRFLVSLPKKARSRASWLSQVEMRPMCTSSCHIGHCMFWQGCSLLLTSCKPNLLRKLQLSRIVMRHGKLHLCCRKVFYFFGRWSLSSLKPMLNLQRGTLGQPLSMMSRKLCIWRTWFLVLWSILSSFRKQ